MTTFHDQDSRVWFAVQNPLLKSVSTGFCTDRQLLFPFVLAFVVTVTSLTQFLRPHMNVRVMGRKVHEGRDW